MQAGAALDALEAAVSLAHHHDAITGTAKQAVADDYARRLAAGTAAVRATFAATLSSIMFGGGGAPGTAVASGATAARGGGAVIRTDEGGGGGPADQDSPGGPPPLHHCEAANVSLCSVTLEQSANCEAMMLVVHNPVAWPRNASLSVRPQSAHPSAST